MPFFVEKTKKVESFSKIVKLMTFFMPKLLQNLKK